jgi:hypothetical protein
MYQYQTKSKLRNNMKEIIQKILSFKLLKSAHKISEDAKQQDDLKIKKTLTIEQRYEIMTYPSYWRPTLTKAAERGESIKDTYEELKDFENLW